MSKCEVNLISSVLCGPVDVCVLLPGPAFRTDPREFYASEKKYKVLWVLHGGNNDRFCFLNSTRIADHVQGRDVIVVMPNGLNSDFADHPEFGDGYNYCKFFFNELMPFIYRFFPASDKPEDNFITGYSMGAAAAWMYGLLKPELFGGIAPIGSALKNYESMEQFRDMGAEEFRAAAGRDNKLFPTGYGPANSGIKAKEINMIAKYCNVGAFLDSMEHTQYRFAEAAEKGTIPKVYLPCGTKDPMYGKVRAFQEFAETLHVDGITYDFVEDAVGGYGFCDMILPKVLDFFEI